MAIAVLDSSVLIDYKDTSADGRHERAEDITRLETPDDPFD